MPRDVVPCRELQMAARSAIGALLGAGVGDTVRTGSHDRQRGDRFERRIRRRRRVRAIVRGPLESVTEPIVRAVPGWIVQRAGSRECARRLRIDGCRIGRRIKCLGKRRRCGESISDLKHCVLRVFGLAACTCRRAAVTRAVL